MEMIELYIPSSFVANEENLRSFYRFYEELSSEIPFMKNDISIKDRLLKKAKTLNEPALEKYIKENF